MISIGFPLEIFFYARHKGAEVRCRLPVFMKAGRRRGLLSF